MKQKKDAVFLLHPKRKFGHIFTLRNHQKRSFQVALHNHPTS